MLLIELTGDAPDIAVEEVRALAIAYGQCFSVIESDGRVLVTETNVPIGKLQERLALSWSIGKHHSSCEYHEIVNSTSDLSLPGRTFRVSVKRLDGTASPEEAVRITRELGAALSINHEVNLDNPDVEVLVLLGERAHIGIIRANIDRTLLEARKSENRPFSQPISLHPKFIRAMVNLTGIREGQFLLDPFCGTGGILLEAGLMEIRTYGSDIDERMIDGTRQNLEHFGVQDFQLF
jgi:tRNA (guanine10-N2)-dimethyltransferase